MRRSKSKRIFLGAVTAAMATAGTGLTIANNWENDFQVAAIAITLAASFTTAEICFLWGHKVFESLKRLNRKITLAISLGVLVLSMGYAVYEELNLALHKVSNRSLASNTKEIVQASDKKNQRVAIKESIAALSNNKIDPKAVPFVLCYVIAGIISIIILAVDHQPEPRLIRRGNVLPENPTLQTHIKQIGFQQPTVKAYEERNGYALWDGQKYLGYVSKNELKT